MPKLAPGAAAAAALVVLAAAFYRGLLLDRLIIGDYDAFVYFYPLREYAARVLGQGSFPLWNPYLFMGAPFFANIQTAVLYPPNVLFLLLPTPHAFSASVVLHVLLAAVGMYLFGRRVLEVAALPSLLGAVAFAFGGFISAQVSHINQLSVSAWLPLLLVVFDQALRRRSLPLAVLTGLIGTLQFLAGHTQEWYFSTVALGLLALWRMLAPHEEPTLDDPGSAGTERTGALSKHPARAYPPKGRLLLPIVLLAVAGLTEAGLSAIQLLPTMELSRESIRGGGMSYGEAVSFSLPPSSMLYTILPTYPSTLFSEYVGYLGVVPLVLAALAVSGWRRRSAVLFMVGLTALGLIMAIGGYNPLAPWLFKWIPGLDLFRVPARWLLIYTLGIAGLAALGAQILKDRAEWTYEAFEAAGPGRRAGFIVASSLLGTAGLVLALLAVVARPSPSRESLLAWVGLASGALALWTVGYLRPRLGAPILAFLIAVTVAELWAAGADHPSRYPVPAAAYAAKRDSTSFILEKMASDAAPERVLSVATDNYEVKETPDYKKEYSWLPQKSLTQFLVDVKLSETLAPNTPMEHLIQSPDGYDGGVLPLKRYAQLKSAVIPAEDAAPDSLLRNKLPYVPSERFLDLLGVEYVLGSKIKDASVENVYYDRGLSIDLASGQSRTLNRIQDIQATSIGVISSTLGARDLAAGTLAGNITVTMGSGEKHQLPLKLGTETAESAEEDGKLGSPAHGRPLHVAIWPPGTKDTDYFVKLRLPSRGRVESVTIDGVADGITLRVRALTLIDDQDALVAPLVLSDAMDRQLFFDMKVYSLRDPLPRALMVYNSTVRDDELALAELEQGRVDVRQVVALAPSSTARGISRTQGPNFDPLDARVSTYRPEEVVIDATAREDGYLVLMDVFYPGWTAQVDGREVPIERANYLFRGVWLEKGSHRVVFRYSPGSFETGKMVTGVSVVLVGFVLLASRRRSTPPRGVL